MKDEWLCSLTAKNQEGMHPHSQIPGDKINIIFRNTVCNTHEGILVL